ncbi:type VI secretion system baseplate subunit TssE [Methylobacterium brachythecii]|uniref:Type VI secretion protein n=1 Tax=Methylobacterium brachythecii TaxID=1176177 RepID=A0A7W6AFJ2_9HYPH|nr:type VI secretion system baseplate subunit TssE [Methylobacterium brachythecii]MBB3902380.1 type VI secretion system protein ImpF [Methylobacterium brachythecii]GLS42228.1 type VI secretion protein [Methylobacterium brachythecii]
MAARADAKRIRIPVMEAFRAAHAQKDARLHVDVRDESGERVLAGRRSGARAAVTANDLQRSVARDLERLMNAVQFAADTDISDFPQVQRSILNHGFVDISRLSIDDIGVDEVGREIVSALRIFEPRLAPASITSQRDSTIDPAELKLRFVVRAEIEADPLNVPVEFVAELERDTGRIKVAQR